jgi:poly(3-hydroxybutyrate) depolymerase
MKISTLALVVGLSGVSLVACKVENYDDTECAGYLGCSAHTRIGQVSAGPAATGAAGMGMAGTGGTAKPVGRPATGVNAIAKGAGCGKPLPAMQPETVPGTPKGYMHYTVQGTGATLAATIAAKAGPRTFWVRVPPGYNPDTAYKVVYIGQGCGGYEIANTNTLPLFKESLGGSEEAIYVALDIPRQMANMDCYDNRDGPSSQEWEAFELFHTVIDTNYCVDNNRVYVSGYSTGGWLANMWGCYFAGDGMNPVSTPGVPRKFAPKYHIRGQAAVTGGEPANQPPCNGPVAGIWIHDAGDNANPISGNISGLMRVGKMNNCDTKYDGTDNQEPWHPEIPIIGDVCKRFKGCPEDYPVIFCTTNGLGHADQKERATAAFKAFFDLLNPLPP